jgi:hypothetical protein
VLLQDKSSGKTNYSAGPQTDITIKKNDTPENNNTEYSFDALDLTYTPVAGITCGLKVITQP